MTTAPEGFVRICTVGDLDEDAPKRFEIDGVPVSVVRTEGEIFAINDICAHRGGSLSDGEFEAGAVTCPLHGWQFNVKDGSSAGVGRGGAACFEVREAGGRAEVRMPVK